MIRLITFVLSFFFYITPATVVPLNNGVGAQLPNGHIYTADSIDDMTVGETTILIMDNNGTETPIDDIVMGVFSVAEVETQLLTASMQDDNLHTDDDEFAKH